MEYEDGSAIQPLNELSSPGAEWTVACFHGTEASSIQFLKITNLLLEQVQLNSTHLFRADILLDTSSELQSLVEKEANYETHRSKTLKTIRLPGTLHVSAAPAFEGYQHQRTVVRRLIPRKPQLDQPLEQSCFIYHGASSRDSTPQSQNVLVVYQPHCDIEDSMPWYHPKVHALAYAFTKRQNAPTLISVHYRPFPKTSTPLPDRLTRTFQSLLKTMLRLLIMPSKTDQPACQTPDNITTMSLAPAKLKDTLLPQHIVQDTYARLKQTYATDLIARWVEKTEPSKHVFEDLSIAAFLIELWNTMYEPEKFPGFVDIACGNGVLVYVLIKEGFQGFGFDARRRKTWEVLGIDEYLHEQVCIPKPFLDASTDSSTLRSEMSIHDGAFPSGTFIISNHADELTCWTPFLAAISQPESPLPFLAIPCCSHALDGSRRRYTPKDITASQNNTSQLDTNRIHEDEAEREQGQPATGDLKALRAKKQQASGDDKSMYACLTRKTASLAQELGIEVELTLMRIPSTRNIGIVGGRKNLRVATPTTAATAASFDNLSLQDGNMNVKPNVHNGLEKVVKLVERECAATGGVETSAKNWIERARNLQGGQGRGKVNWNSHVVQGNGLQDRMGGGM